MRKLLIVLLLCIVSIELSYGQETWINLNRQLKITDTAWVANYKVRYLRDSSNVKIYDVIRVNNACANDYSGFLYSNGLNSQTGYMVLYYYNGQAKSKGNYLNGKEEGDWVEYYENGQIDNRGEFVNGRKNNAWYWYYRNGQVSSKEQYDMNKLVSIQMWDSLGNSVANPEKVDRLPLLKKGDKNMREFRNRVASNLKYPDLAAEKSITGKVLVQFCIDENGNLINEKVIRGVDVSLDKEALRVVGLCKKWIPAIQHNRRTKISFTLPIIFNVQ